jgi:phosphoribosylformylglycinamidine synthase subunit PurQ / glutaminase
MKTKKWVSVLYVPGTNCERETLAAFELAGARARLLFLTDLLRGKAKITDCNLFCVPGGFSFGDYIKEGIIAAVMLRDFLPELKRVKIPSLWICNGCQIGGRLRVFGQGVTLTRNVSGVFMSRPVQHLVMRTDNIWARNLAGRVLSFPSAHGGGRVVYTRTPEVVMTYASESPNGGPIAAVGSSDGLALGIMDHPERPYGNPDGQEIFRNGLAAV